MVVWCCWEVLYVTILLSVILFDLMTQHTNEFRSTILFYNLQSLYYYIVTLCSILLLYAWYGKTTPENI